MDWSLRLKWKVIQIVPTSMKLKKGCEGLDKLRKNMK
jgi:hypothetical protein